jgi:hypothetical protein
MTKFLAVFLVVMQLQIVSGFAQSQELGKIQRDIAQAQDKISEVTARNIVTEFFAQRFGYVHQTNGQCLDILTRIKGLATQLKTPELFSKKITNSEQAYAVLEVLANVVMRENLTLGAMNKLHDELNLQKNNLHQTELFLGYDRVSVIKKFPKPDDIENATIYYETLWKEYQINVQEIGEKLKFFTSKCGNINFDISKQEEKRKAVYKEFYSKVVDFYLKAYQEEYLQGVFSIYKPSENNQTLLGLHSAFNELDRRYRDAIMLDYDYFKSMNIIESYESIAIILLARIVPMELNPTIRIQAEKEAERRALAAENFGKTIKKQKPSYWLSKRFDKKKKYIVEGKIVCNSKCKNNLNQVESLIGAARIIEDVSTELVYAMLGNQALDLIR